MNVGTIMESNDATFFEDIFPMKDMPSSSSQRSETTPGPTVPLEHSEKKHTDIPEEDDNEAPRRSKRQRTTKSFGEDFIVYLMNDTPISISKAYASLDVEY